MDELLEALDLGPENDQHLHRLRRALALGTGFQLILVEVSRPDLKAEVLRRLRLWSGKDDVPTITLVQTRAGLDPVAGLHGIIGGALLTGIDSVSVSETTLAPIEYTMTTLNWYRDKLPLLVPGPLVIVLSQSGLRQLFVHAPDLLAWRSHVTRITAPRPVELELRSWPNRREALEEKAWLERMIAASASNPEGPLARGLPGWFVRLGEIEGREGGPWRESFARAEALASGRRDILFMLELARAHRALDDERYGDAETHEGRAADLVSGSIDTSQAWESARMTAGRDPVRREQGPISHDTVFADVRVLRAERLLHIGEVEQAGSVAAAALHSALASGDLALVIAALGITAAVAANRSDIHEATARFQELREVARVARDRAAELFALIHLAELASETEHSGQLYQQARSIMKEGDHEAHARACLGLAMHALSSGDAETAGRILSEVAQLEQLRPRTRIRIFIARGEVATAQAHHDTARDAYQMAWHEQKQRIVPPSREQAKLAIRLGEAALRASDPQTAATAFQRAAEIASVIGDPSLIATALAGRAAKRQ